MAPRSASLSGKKRFHHPHRYHHHPNTHNGLGAVERWGMGVGLASWSLRTSQPLWSHRQGEPLRLAVASDRLAGLGAKWLVSGRRVPHARVLGGQSSFPPALAATLLPLV